MQKKWQFHIDKRVGATVMKKNSQVGIGTRIRKYDLSFFEPDVLDDMR